MSRKTCLEWRVLESLGITRGVFCGMMVFLCLSMLSYMEMRTFFEMLLSNVAQREETQQLSRISSREKNGRASVTLRFS
jgi:hypothetical protein